MWEHFRHGADIGIRGFGGTPDEAFAEAALALTAVVTEPARVAGKTRVEMACAAPELDFLLVAWLNRLVYEMASRRMLFRRFDVRIANLALQAAAWGEPVDRLRHEPAVEVKGATLTALKVAQEPDGRWVAQCIVDV